jgi:RNA polymerase sigma-70 factor (ECF subfamily)
MTPPLLTPNAGQDFEALALPHLEAIRRFAQSLTRNAADADDLVQETFIRAMRGWHTFRPDSHPRAWLFMICRNIFLRLQRRRRATLAIEDDDPDVTSAIASRARATHVEQANMLDSLDVRPAVQGAIGDLREPYRTAVALVDLENRSYEEAAAALGVTTGTMKTRVHRARRLLRGTLMAYAVDAGLRTRRARPRRPVSEVLDRPLRCA